FYELFFEDAEVAARALGIVLTKRGKHLGRDIPMCGVPIHRADEYLHRLIVLGHRVAVCEQLEDPAEAKKRGGKSVVRRDVIRLVTPGTLTEDTLLDAKRNNYLLAIARARASVGEESRFALAWIDISTGEFRIAECDRAGLAADIARLEPGEIIVSDALYGDSALAPYLRSLPAGSPVAPSVVAGPQAQRWPATFFGFATPQTLRAPARPRPTGAPPLPQLRGAHAARGAPAAVCARARDARSDALDRSGDPQQSRARAHALGRAPWIAPCRHRPQRNGGGRPAARPTAGGPPAPPPPGPPP